jgi:hypothetical protein
VSVVGVVCCLRSPIECVSFCVIRCYNNHLRFKRIRRRDQAKEGRRQRKLITKFLTMLIAAILGFDVATVILFLF